MITTSLSPEALAQRRLGIGGSDARIVVHGEPAERYALWKDKIGEAKPKKIMSDWNYALRMATETLQLDWYEHCNPGARVHNRGSVLVSEDYPFMRCTLDGVLKPTNVPINAKHVSRWTKEAREWCIEHYTPQVTHEAIVCEADYGLLSLLHGEKEPEIIRIDVDPIYAEHLIARERDFWRRVEERTPPEDCAELDAPKTAVKVERLRHLTIDGEPGSPAWVEMVRRNQWVPELVTLFGDFSRTHAAAAVHAITRENIKKLLPDDVGEVEHALARVTRNRAGSVTIALKEKPDA